VLDGDRGRAEEPLAAGLRITKGDGAGWLQDQLESLARRGRLEQSDGRAPPDDPSSGLG